MTWMVNVGCSDGKKASGCYFESSEILTCVNIRRNIFKRHLTEHRQFLSGTSADVGTTAAETDSVTPASQTGRFKPPNLNSVRVKIKCRSPVVQLLMLRQLSEKPRKQPASIRLRPCSCWTSLYTDAPEFRREKMTFDICLFRNFNTRLPCKAHERVDHVSPLH